MSPQPARPLAVGDVIHGFAYGAFGRDHYDCVRIEAVGPGWDVEPCDTAPPDPRPAETRFGHGLDHPDGRPRIIPGDHGQPPGRRRDLEPRHIHNVLESL
ncbi:hypothetical protein [Streptomyces sp. NPDC046161]|uniref:hypothetical protein n=1 Tax=Streptomyces sp. NPDC046161 TaxID=3155132 RepID=UPI0033F245BD